VIVIVDGGDGHARSIANDFTHGECITVAAGGE
jgi:hypothetical protein